MKRIAAGILFAAVAATVVVTSVPVRAQSAAPAMSATAPSAALDPEAQRLLLALAGTLVASFASSAARGSLDGFDPGPVVESALRNALASPALNRAVERMVDQAGNSAEGAPMSPAMSPEMRALLKAALSGVVTMARNEMARELAGPASPGAVNP